ncbi:hypothetical protein BGZ49_009713 [Haplosporangium sp. Z 27]|nr:hypothetical protein BGZ49_009713 [Haplosporangium sp. Z 27]
MPGFEDITWKDIKLLHGTGHIRTAEISYAATRDATLKAFEQQRIQCVHIAHTGRHSGAIETQKLGIIQEEIKTGGRRVCGNGKMRQFYLSSYPLPLALDMEGFKDKPFYLKRNEVSPPIELQQKIFPFVGKAFGDPETETYKAWRQECVD